VHMKVLITLMGPSHWGMFNSIWGMIRSHDYVPDRIYILGREKDWEGHEKAKRMIVPLVKEYGGKGEMLFEKIKGDSVSDVVEKVRKIGEKEKQRGNTLALDITPGRKAVVLGSLFAGWTNHLFDRIFYLYIESLRNANRPYMLIPMSIQVSHDIMEERR